MRSKAILGGLLLATCITSAAEVRPLRSVVVLAEPGPCVLGPWTVAGNFAVDLDGRVLPADREAGIWGLREAWAWPLQFFPPSDYRVRIVRVSGDLAARLTTRGVGPAIATPGTYVGVLAAIASRYPSAGSVRADFAADDTFAYVQVDLGWPEGKAHRELREDHEGVANALLGPEHQLWIVAAKYLDETGLATHLEVTLSSVRFQFEKETGCED